MYKKLAEIVPLVWITRYPNGVLANGGISALCSAVRDAVDVYGCRIINISSGVSIDDEALREAVEYAEEKGVIVISSAGNSNQYAPDEIFYPAAYETMVSVGSVNEEMHVSDFSQKNDKVSW
jgi:minor extracellular protease Epr